MAQQASPVTKKIVGFVFTFAGVVMLYFSWYNYDKTSMFLETARPASGVVVDFETHHSSSSGSSGSSTTYAPIVEFHHPEDGRTIRFTSDVSSSPPAYDEGEEVKVLFSPDDPEEAHIDSFFSLWFLPLMLLVMGGIFMPVGIAVMRSKSTRDAV